MLAAGGDAGPRMWWRRLGPDGWMIVAAVALSIALGTGLAFMIGVR
jgi:hypothetical protein